MNRQSRIVDRINKFIEQTTIEIITIATLILTGIALKIISKIKSLITKHKEKKTNTSKEIDQHELTSIFSEGENQ